jgi:hypothetical protein
VSDDGFDFGPAPPRREVRQFEIPPWEREQFERHAREQAERDKALRDAQETAWPQGGTGSDEGSGGSADEGLPGQKPDGGSREPGEPQTGRPTGSGAASATKTQVDEKQVAMMMLELRTEEPPTLTNTWAVILGAGVVLGLVGLVVAIWGVVALVRLGRMGALGGSVLMVFGLTFAGIGGGLIFKALRQRGVL